MLVLTNKTIEKLKHDLVREGLVNLDGLILAEDNAKNNETNLAQELVNENLISENELLNFIENKLHIPSVDLNDYMPDINCFSYIPAEKAKKYNIFPLFKIEDVLTIAMSDPLDLFTINTLFENENISIEPVVCSEQSITNAIDKYYFNQTKIKNYTNWQDKIIADNISDESLKDAIWEIIKDGINHDNDHIYMERSHSGLNLYFNKELKGYIPNLLVPRFLFELNNICDFDNETEDIPQSSKINIDNRGMHYTILASYFPTKFGARISLVINRPLKNIQSYGFSKTKIDELFSHASFIGLELNNENEKLVYSLGEYLSETKSVLIVENKVKYELNNVAQFEFDKNTAINFDEILSQIELQKFDVIIWEKIYTEEQAKKLKLLSKEKIILTLSNQELLTNFDFVMYSNGNIK